MKTFVIGDIHGRYKALKEVLEKSSFNYDEDELIVLGDIVDGGINTYKVVEELLKIKNVIYIIGNHDEWFINHIKTGWSEKIWLQQGGANTLKSYGAKVKLSNYVSNESFLDTANMNIPVTHQDFFNRGKYYYLRENTLFVHGGIKPKIPLNKQKKEDLLWDRDLITFCGEGNNVPNFDKVYIGHTTTQNINGDTLPLQLGDLIMMDTGAGWNGKLTIMDIDSEDYWQSKLQSPS